MQLLKTHRQAFVQEMSVPKVLERLLSEGIFTGHHVSALFEYEANEQPGVLLNMVGDCGPRAFDVLAAVVGAANPTIAALLHQEECSDAELLAMGDKIAMGQTLMQRVYGRNGCPYMLVSRPTKYGKVAKCAWFKDDWDGIVSFMPKVKDILENKDAYTLPQVFTKPVGNRELIVTVTECWVVIEVKIKRAKDTLKFGLGILQDEWSRLSNVKDHITWLLSENRRKRKSDPDAVQPPCKKTLFVKGT